MPNYVLNYFDECSSGKKLKKLFEKTMSHTLNFLGKTESTYLISLTLIDENKMQSLNNEYRKKDSPTDVLTLAYPEEEKVNDEFIDLGDIFICPSVAKKQALEYKHPFDRELVFLFIHGILHTLGYDHVNSETEANKMFQIQNEILNSIDYDFYTNVSKAKILVKEAQNNALPTYSKFKVGAIIATKDGKYHRGFNIENSAYGCCMCGERVALYHTYALGYHKEDIASLTLITDSKEIGTPCGSCRQVMSELMDKNCFVYIYNFDQSKVEITTVEKLLPGAFSGDNLL